MGVASRYRKQNMSLKSFSNGFPYPTIKLCYYYDHQNPQTQLCYNNIFKCNYVLKHNKIVFIFSKRDAIQIDFIISIFYSYFEAFMMSFYEGFKMCYSHIILICHSAEIVSMSIYQHCMSCCEKHREV